MKKKVILDKGKKRIDRRKKVKQMHIIDENTTDREFELAKRDLTDFFTKRYY